MSSIALLWSDIKEYVDSVGPTRGRPQRPLRCPRCEHDRIWYDGWRLVFCVVLINRARYRFDDGLWLQRVARSLCWFSRTCRPAFLYPHRSFEPDLVETAALAYLKDPAATYAGTSRQYGCSLTMLWGWIGWLADLAAPGEIVAEAARLDHSLPAAELIPHSVPQSHPKGYSPERQNVLLRAFQVLIAIITLGHAQTVPLSDPSFLRWFLVCQFHVFRRKALLSRPGWSPAIEVAHRGPT